MASSGKHLTLGHIRYLNCVPFFGALAQQGFQGSLVSGVPSELNRMLQQGQLDASPSSSFEYARNWRDYLLLPGHSISSTGKIASVLLFSPVSPEHLDGHTISITGESATSSNLLRVILREFYHHSEQKDYIPDRPVEEIIALGRPALLIGDRALKQAARTPKEMQIFDLGELWYRHTGVPFVFALWLIRRAVVTSFELQLEQLGGQLLRSRTTVIGRAPFFAAAASQIVGLSVQDVIGYWHRIDYDLTGQHLAGLQLFFQLCTEHGLLNEVPELKFYPDT